ncbi:MAG TPA: RNA helicase, partial [Streptomyces sp.]|nr:RNA helicase [Streptomyces sp.]
GYNRDRRDDRPSGGSSGGRSYERRDERPSGGGYNRDRRDDRSGGGSGGGASRPFERREHSGYRTGGGDRPVNRDRRDDRPLSRDRRDERPARRDDHRGGTGSTSSTGSSTGARSFDRRTEKPRWKRNG